MAPPAGGANASSSAVGGAGGTSSSTTTTTNANAANNTTTSSSAPTTTTTTTLSGTKRKSSTKSSHSRSYPRGVGLDFRKLAGLTLISYIDHHGVKVRSEAPPSELAVAVARHFESFEVEEEQCVGGFLERLEVGTSATTDYARNTQHNYIGGDYTTTGAIRGSHTSNTANNAGNNIKQRNKRTKWAARPGEQVAAKVTRTDENGSWILASVQRFYPDTETYDVQDEDDTSKLIRLPWSHVMRLSTGSEGCFNSKNTDCMAIFPETTSFYKAKVSKAPVWKLDHGVPTVKEIIVKFDDDEDSATGKTPHRRVPARYVIPVPSVYFYDESEDVDLDPPTRTPILSAASTSTSTPTTSGTTTNTMTIGGGGAVSAANTNAAPSAVVGGGGVPSFKNGGKK